MLQAIENSVFSACSDRGGLAESERLHLQTDTGERYFIITLHVIQEKNTFCLKTSISKLYHSKHAVAELYLILPFLCLAIIIEEKTQKSNNHIPGDDW